MELRTQVGTPKQIETDLEDAATPESWTRLPKVISQCDADVFRSKCRSHTRSANDSPLDALWRGGAGTYLTQSVSKMFLQKSSPPQIRRLSLYYDQYKE